MSSTTPPQTDLRRVSVIVPAFNESKTIVELLRRVRAQAVVGFEFEIIVIDDGSTDGTAGLVKQHPELCDRLVEQPRNGGKGAAVRTGLGHATGEYVLFQDADLEYHPSEYAKLLAPVADFGADLVMGSRMLAPTYTRVYYFWHKVGNCVITLLFNLANNTTFTDIYSCYLLYKRDLLDPADLVSDGWDQHAEILARVWRRAEACYEVPINYSGRTYAEGKKIRARHAIAVVFMILRQRFTAQTKRKET